MDKFEAIVFTYGVVNTNGDMFTEQAAIQLHDQLAQQIGIPLQLPGMYGYHITSTRIEGDREKGNVCATFEQNVAQ